MENRRLSDDTGDASPSFFREYKYKLEELITLSLYCVFIYI
ncbi:hypothetical protein [Sedimentibacter sp.]|nr:hypothetical protein [Sedimentibacter sp.]